MTVEELIHFLEQYPKNSKVTFVDDFGPCEITDIWERESKGKKEIKLLGKKYLELS